MVLFGMSVGEVVLILGVGAWAFGEWSRPTGRLCCVSHGVAHAQAAAASQGLGLGGWPSCLAAPAAALPSSAPAPNKSTLTAQAARQGRYAGTNNSCALHPLARVPRPTPPAAGPKELPRMGRMLGRATGRATGFLYRMRSQVRLAKGFCSALHCSNSSSFFFSSLFLFQQPLCDPVCWWSASGTAGASARETSARSPAGPPAGSRAALMGWLAAAGMICGGA